MSEPMRPLRLASALLTVLIVLDAALAGMGAWYVRNRHDDAVKIAHQETAQFEHRLWNLLCNSDPPPIPIQRDPFCSRLFPKEGTP